MTSLSVKVEYAGRTLMYKLKNSALKILPCLRPAFVENGFVMLSLSNKETLGQQYNDSII